MRYAWSCGASAARAVMQASMPSMMRVTAAKVVLADIAQVQQGYRVTLPRVLGLLLLGASWLYHRLGERVRGPR